MNIQRIYEIGMLVNPNLSQQETEKTIEKIKEILNNNSASVISEGEIVKIDLAYQIITKIASKNERFDEASFTWIKFESNPEVIDTIKKEIDKNKKEIFRYLITKTIADDDLTDKFKLVEEDSDSDNQEKNDDMEELKNNEKEKKEVEKVVENESGKVEKESDDLTKIEGIGPKTKEVLAEAGIKTFADLAGSKVTDLRKILEENGLNRYDPKTWSKQARLARDEKWDELKTLQDELKGGE